MWWGEDGKIEVSEAIVIPDAFFQPLYRINKVKEFEKACRKECDLRNKSELNLDPPVSKKKSFLSIDTNSLSNFPHPPLTPLRYLGFVSPAVWSRNLPYVFPTSSSARKNAINRKRIREDGGMESRDVNGK